MNSNKGKFQVGDVVVLIPHLAHHMEEHTIHLQAGISYIIYDIDITHDEWDWIKLKNVPDIDEISGGINAAYFEFDKGYLRRKKIDIILNENIDQL